MKFQLVLQLYACPYVEGSKILIPIARGGADQILMFYNCKGTEHLFAANNTFIVKVLLSHEEVLKSFLKVRTLSIHVQ